MYDDEPPTLSLKSIIKSFEEVFGISFNSSPTSLPVVDSNSSISKTILLVYVSLNVSLKLAVLIE